MDQSCKQCQANFTITDEDLVFYDKVSPVFNGVKCSIPAPVLCPDCRHQRRITFRNDRNMYQRKCDGTGKAIVSLYSPDKPYPVYENPYWWSDAWDECSYGRDFDFSKTFTEQFRELQLVVPRLSMIDDGVQSLNCQYCQDFAYGKNCYLVIGSWHVEDVLYSEHLTNVKDSSDCLMVNTDTELAYECINSSNLYQCIYVTNSQNCRDCFFGFDLIGCKNCFGCSSLRQKEYYIFNKAYSKEEYENKIKEFDVGSYAFIESMKVKFDEFVKTLPHKSNCNRNCENCVGNYLYNSKDSDGFEFFNSQNARYCIRGISYQNSMDMYQAGLPQWSYNSVTCDEGYMNHFSLYCWKGKYNLYSDTCQNCENVFGCISMKRKKYCILNKQYTEEEYEALMPKIIEHMKSTGEWAEYFDKTLTPFSYNETIAQDYFLLKKDEALAQGFLWKEDMETLSSDSESTDIPDHIRDVKDDITQKVLHCQKSGKKYKILPQELALYRKMNIPIPRLCFNERHLERTGRVNPRKLWNRQCAKCSKAIQTSYAPERPEKVYCEDCYLKEVY